MVIDGSFGYYPNAELVFGLVSPIGIDYKPIVSTLKNYLEQFGYTSREIKISEQFDGAAERLGIEVGPNPYVGQMASMWRKIELGDHICKKTQTKDVLAIVATAMIEEGRQREDGGRANLWSPKTAHIIISLKRPQEVATLRRIYGPGFFLIGLAANESEREKFFEERGIGEDHRSVLIRTDAAEGDPYGQRTRNTFFLSDVFISLSNPQVQIARFLDLVFGCPFITPSSDERAMQMAYAASLTSGDLARQVGAALIDDLGDCLGLGWNEVPKAFGGLYGPEDSPFRDMDIGEDSNDTEKLAMAVSIIQALLPNLSHEQARLCAREKLADTGFFDITEFGRAVHAEMAAILACARSGRSPRNANLSVTTFPCHTCTRHIIASGIKRVNYIEPYPKSKAIKLHGDACTESNLEHNDKIPFVPFIGIGPRRYLDLFSLTLGTGYPIERKVDGKKVAWNRESAKLRLQMAPVSYLVREQLASSRLQDLLSRTAPSPVNEET